MIDWLGWLATAVFTASYFCKGEKALRRVQMIGASIWMAYGVLLPARPVIVANVLGIGALVWTSRRPR